MRTNGNRDCIAYHRSFDAQRKRAVPPPPCQTNSRSVPAQLPQRLHSELTGGLAAMPLTARYDAGGRLLHVDRGALPEAALPDRLATLYGVVLRLCRVAT